MHYIMKFKGMCSKFTFPHGESQEGSPGLEAFQSAKSLGKRFSLSRSAEMLRSPAAQKRDNMFTVRPIYQIKTDVMLKKT